MLHQLFSRRYRQHNYSPDANIIFNYSPDANIISNYSSETYYNIEVSPLKSGDLGVIWVSMGISLVNSYIILFIYVIAGR